MINRYAEGGGASTGGGGGRGVSSQITRKFPHGGIFTPYLSKDNFPNGQGWDFQKIGGEYVGTADLDYVVLSCPQWYSM